MKQGIFIIIQSTHQMNTHCEKNCYGEIPFIK